MGTLNNSSSAWTANIMERGDIVLRLIPFATLPAKSTTSPSKPEDKWWIENWLVVIGGRQI